MTFGEYKELEEICKSGWSSIAEQVLSDKPSMFHKYANHCPACHIAQSVEAYPPYCRYCPVDRWRTREEEAEGVCPCHLDNEAYDRWVYPQDYAGPDQTIDDVIIAAAKEIANLTWSYLPEYSLAAMWWKEKDGQ